MKKFQFRFTNHIILKITRAMMFILASGFFGMSAFSQSITAPNVTRCGEGDVTLAVTASSGCSGGDFYWYDQPFYGSSIGKGTSFTATGLQESKTFYVDYVVSGVGICTRQPVTAIISTSNVTPNIYYPSNTYCNSLNADQAVTNTGSPYGKYTVSPNTSLVVDQTTGKFNPYNVTPGDYTITYTVPPEQQPEGCSEDPASTTITIAALQATPVIASFTTPLCSTAAPITIGLSSGPSGGIFSASPSGLSITGGGYVDPSASVGGTYTVTYTKSGTGGCLAVSNVASLTIHSASVAGNAAPAYSPISAGTGTTISLSGYNGAIQWQSSADNSSYTTISGQTASTLSTGNLAATTYYRALVTNGVCSTATGGTVTVVVSTNSVAGTASAATENICYGSTATLTLTGNTGTIQWQTNATGSFVDINGATGASYTTPALTASTSYRAVVTNGVSAPDVSNEVSIQVIPASVGGTINSATICYGSSATLLVSESVGAIQWQTKSGEDWVDIGTATGTEYTTPELTATTSYRAVVTSSPCSSAVSNVAVVTVDPASAGGTATAALTTICSGGATVITLSGYTGTIQWQTNASGSFANIKGETGSTYSTPALTTTTSYKAVVTSGTCEAATSEVATVTVAADPEITAEPSATTTLCVGGTATLSVTATGGTGDYSYQWYSSTENGTSSGTSVTGATASSYTPPTDAAGTIYYYVKVNASGNGCSEATSSVAAVTVAADPEITAEPSATTTLCVGGTASLSVTATGGTGGYSYQWYSNTINSTVSGTLIESATASSYTPLSTEAGTKYYYVIVNALGNGCSEVTSSVAAVTVNGLPTITTTGAALSQCYSASQQNTTLAYSATTNTPVSYSIDWIEMNDQASTPFSFAQGGGSISNIRIPAATAPGTYTGTMTIANGNGCTSTQAVSVTVNQILTASVTITADPSATVCDGSTVTFTATPVNGVTDPIFQWKKGGVNIDGQTSSTYSYSPSNSDKITVTMNSNSLCILGLPATSNEITMTVNSVLSIVGTISGTATATPETPYEYSITPVSGANGYTWTAPEGWIIQSGSDTNKIVVTSGAKGQGGSITVTADNACGSSAPESLAVTIP